MPVCLLIKSKYLTPFWATDTFFVNALDLTGKIQDTKG
jgi:hypothetical protein